MENQIALNFSVARDASRDAIERLSFIALYVFALLLYLRPQEMFPSIFGTFPLVKLVAIFALATFIVGRLRLGQRISIWPVELKMLALLIGLSVAIIPLATSPDDSFKVLSDPFVKVVAIFVLMINLIDTRERLTSILRVIVVVGSFMALAAVRSYLAGEFTLKSTRITGVVSGLFGNPNDLATSLDLIIPFALALALMNRRGKRLLYVLCGVALTAGVVVTFSRGGFLGLLAMAAFFAWKLGRFRKGFTTLVLVSTVAIFMIAVPASYSGRLGSIFNSDEDATGSSQARLDLLVRSSEVAISHPIVGVGLGNFHIFSIGEQKAHNSYLEIAAELGVLGLIAYLVILVAPFRYLRKIEKDSLEGGWPGGVSPSHSRTSGAGEGRSSARDRYYLSITIQGALIGYAVCSFFGSIQYFWDLYLIVAYAISLKRISKSDGAELREAVPGIRTEAGVLWSKNQSLSGQLS
jgi:putative inorganic carbon (HCO3(-)) transporter